MRKLCCTITILLFAVHAYARDVFSEYVSNAQLVGEGRLTVMLWDVYDAQLYAPNGRWDMAKPFALRLHYLRDIDGTDIADRSVEEMRKLGMDNEVRLAAWHTQMRGIFPNVQSGTELTGVYTPNGPTYFYHNNERIGVVTDPEFGQWFFNIWLHAKTSEPQLRRALLGQT